MKQVLFSVIVPVYNKGRVLRETLDSIKNQSFKDFECIIIDDGSTDDSPNISMKYCKEEKNFIIHKYENAGVGTARNRGIEQAKGQYIVFVDADDIIEDRLLEELSNYITKFKDVDLIRYQCKVVHYKQVKEPEKLNYHSQIGQLMTGSEALRNWATANKRFAVSWLYCIKKSIFDGNNIKFPQGIYEDFATLPLVIATSNKVVCVDYTGYNYMHRINETSLMNRRYKRIRKDEGIY